MILAGPVFPPGTRAPITMQGPAFSPIPSSPIMLSDVPGAPAPMQSTGTPLQSATIPPMAKAPWPSQATPYPSAFMALPPCQGICLITCLGPLAQQSSMQAEREELARYRQDLDCRELEVNQITRALNLNAVRDAEAKSAAPMAGSNCSRTQEQAPLKQKCASSQVFQRPFQRVFPQGSRSPVLLPLRL